MIGRERLRDWMRRSKLNQKETAALLGFDQVFISQILNGVRRPGLDNAILIERVTGISVESWLLSEPRTEDPATAADAGNSAQNKA